MKQVTGIQTAQVNIFQVFAN